MFLSLEEQAQFALFTILRNTEDHMHQSVTSFSSHLDLRFQHILVLSLLPAGVIFGNEFPSQKVVKIHDLQSDK